MGGLAVGRSKRTCELTSSIVPRGTLFHRVANGPGRSDLDQKVTCIVRGDQMSAKN